VVVLFTSLCHSESEVPTYSVKLSIMDETGQRTLGSGGFTAEDSDCGLIHLSFYGEGDNFRVCAIGTKQLPYSYRRHGESKFARNLNSLIDVFLRPKATAPGEIRISGLMKILLNQKSSDEPEFSIIEKQLGFTLSGEKEKAITIPAGKDGAPIIAKISVTVLGDEDFKPVPKPDIPQVTLNTSYSLYNKDKDKYKYKDSKCELGFGSGVGGVGSCTWDNMFFDLEGGDSLFYLASCELKDVFIDESENIVFSMMVTRIYAVNPGLVSHLPEEIKADHLTKVSFQKAISTREGQETVINIPPDKDGLMPFEAEEKIKIICEVE
jgi:hypothetical protein